MNFTKTLRAERAIASAWSAYSAIEGTRYELSADYRAVTIHADTKESLAKAVLSLCGPLRFELVTGVDGVSSALAQWHCPSCLTTLATDSFSPLHLSTSDAIEEITRISTEHENDCRGSK